MIDEVDIIVGTFSQVARLDRRLRRRRPRASSTTSSTTAGRSSSRRRCRRPTPPACSPRSQVMQDEPERRERLWANTRRLQEGFRSLGFDIGPTETPIVPVLIGPLEKTFLMWRRLFDAGVFTNPVVPPAVPPSQCRLRTSLMATHTDEQIDFALEQFARIGQGAGGHLSLTARASGAARGPTGPPALHRPALPAARAGPDLGPAVASGRGAAPRPHEESLLRARRGRVLPRRARTATVVGRIAAISNRLHNETHGDRVGFFGFFECERRPGRRRRALRGRGRAGCRPRGFDTCAGPASFSVNDECGSWWTASRRRPPS